MRNVEREALGLFRFYFELARFRLTDWIYEEKKNEAKTD